MDNRKPILDELTPLSPLLAGIQPVPPYAVPEGYFGAFADKLLAHIRNMDASAAAELKALSPLLSSIDKKTPFTAPEGYFTELADNLVSGVKAVDFVKEELEAPILKDLQHRQVYTVPAGYFESFPSLLMQKIQAGKTAQVVKMWPLRRVLQYAAAAAIVGMVLLGVVFFNAQQQPDSMLGAALPADSIATQHISKLPDEAIIEYVEHEGMLMADNTLMVTSAAEIDEEDMREMLNDISIDELNHYVEVHGGEKFLSN